MLVTLVLVVGLEVLVGMAPGRPVSLLCKESSLLCYFPKTSELTLDFSNAPLFLYFPVHILHPSSTFLDWRFCVCNSSKGQKVAHLGVSEKGNTAFLSLDNFSMSFSLSRELEKPEKISDMVQRKYIK